ncbi:hypothetical protein BJV78DRAFT_268279 [Lactifluus subvellereus]|nr:hypothetical protein BJV78DRAFT_268279 [Lactifluus subvellereus]
MPRTLLASFSLLALVVTARPIVPVPYVFGCDVSPSTTLIPVLYTVCSEYSQPAEVQHAIKAIFEERTKQSDVDPLSLAHDEIDIHLVSDEGQQAVLSQLDGSAIQALVPLEPTDSGIFPEVKRLREMLGGSKHLDDIEGASLAELTDDVEVPAPPVGDIEPSGLTSPTGVSSLWEVTRVLTGLTFTSLLAVYTLISVAAVLFAFYFIREFLPHDQDQEEKQPLSPTDVEPGYADEKGTATQEKASSLGVVMAAGIPQNCDPPVGVLVDIDADASVAGDEVDDTISNNSSTSTPRAAQFSGLSLTAEQPWLVPLPPSPPPSPLRRTVQLHEDASAGRNSHPTWAVVAPEEQPRAETRGGNAAAAVDLALAMQLRTGFGVTADAAWLIRFVMAVFGWVAVLVGGGGERRAVGGRRLLGW